LGIPIQEIAIPHRRGVREDLGEGSVDAIETYCSLSHRRGIVLIPAVVCLALGVFETGSLRSRVDAPGVLNIATGRVGDLIQHPIGRIVGELIGLTVRQLNALDYVYRPSFI